MKKNSKILPLIAIISLNAFAETENLQTPPAVNISGVIEVEYGFENLAAGDDTDELTLATAALNIAKTLDKNFDASLILLYEQGENNDNIKVEKAVLNGKTLDGKYAFTVGRLYMPFGAYETVAISDTVGLYLVDNHDDGIVLSANFADGFTASVWWADNENANNKGISLRYAKDVFVFGIDWIDFVAVTNDESGLAIYAKYDWDNFTFIAERIAEIAGNNQAQSTQIEIDYEINDWTFAAVHNNIDNFGDYNSNITLVAEYVLTQEVGLTAEYKTQNRVDNTGDDNVATLRLAYEF